MLYTYECGLQLTIGFSTGSKVNEKVLDEVIEHFNKNYVMMRVDRNDIDQVFVSAYTLVMNLRQLREVLPVLINDLQESQTILYSLYLEKLSKTKEE